MTISSFSVVFILMFAKFDYVELCKKEEATTDI